METVEEPLLPLYARHGASCGSSASRPGCCMYLEPTGERHAPAVETAQPGVIGIAAPPGVAIDLAGLLG